MNNNNIKIIIPSFNCTNKIISVVRNLRNSNINNDILIIDDNSSSKSKLILNFVKNKFARVCVLNNYKNLGQGGSIKKAIKHLNNSDCLICTVDDDGQHATVDIKKIIQKSNLVYFNNSIILGSRDLKFNITPINSYIGNKISSFLFEFITKKKIIDTQTGLRFYGKYIANKFLKINSTGFDFHNIMNYFLIKNKIKFLEVKIKTIYFNNNKQSRFKGTKDSLKILKKIFNYY